MKMILFITLIFISSCNEQELKNYGVLKVEGLDRFGNSRVCYRNEDQRCNSIFDIEEEHFARNCENNGNIAHKCSCHEYVCEIKTFTGADMHGNERSCTQIPESNICTMEFTDSDQYALECVDSGNRAVQCGCHDFICVDESNENPAVSDLDLEEHFGTNQDGVQRACKQMNSGEQCITELDKYQIYAQNCRAEGYDAIWCSCNEVLCLDN